jgi:hypothetical protein
VIFGPDLLPKVLDGTKTVTRRRAGGRDYMPGRTYAVQPVRGQKGVARIRILDNYMVRLGRIAATTGQVRDESDDLAWMDPVDYGDEEARREGFATVDEFVAYWERIHGSWDPEIWVDRIRFELVENNAS